MASTPLTITLEAILFAASEPLSVGRLAQIVGQPEPEVESALRELDTRLAGGIRLAHVSGTYRLVTAPETATVIRTFLEDQTNQDLTKPALETLAIIAYKGPLTKSGVEQVRGVASDTMIRNLLARGLIAEAGRSAEPGRPQLYTVSHSFLQHFGLTNISQLPPLPETPDEN